MAAGLKISAIWALLIGTTLAAMELLLNWGQWQWWPNWSVDFAAAALLLSGGILVLRRNAAGRRWLSAGWAFTLGMAWMSLSANMDAGPDPARDGRVDGFYIALVGILVASAMLGLALSLFARDGE